MKRFSISKKVWLTATAAVLAAGLSIPGAMAYFTTYASAEGGAALELGHTTEIEEKFENWQKDIQIVNTGDVDCYVRVKVLCGSQFTLDISGAGWSYNDGDQYWYYADPTAPDAKTGSLLAQITMPEGFLQDFNVAVVQECTPVQYDADGNPYPDWDLAINEGGIS
jgi:hypothetical protein